MQIILSDFISVNGVVQAPGGPDEDTDGDFRHGGWSNPFFDPDTMGANIGEVMERTDALLFGIIVRMFESGPARPVDVARQQVVAASQELTGIDPAALSGDELLDLLDRLEADTRRRTAVAARLIAELHARGTAGELGYSSTASRRGRGRWCACMRLQRPRSR